MCGIAGLVDFGNRSEGELREALARMHDALAHRGPDGRGRAVLAAGQVFRDPAVGGAMQTARQSRGAFVGFAHQRLAILDLSTGGHQPKASSDERHWVTYNGELYNFRDLQRVLTSRGRRLRTSSDTEVLAELLSLEGEEAIARLRGMFAFAWWDERAQRLVLVRDRFGIKPLVFARPEPDLVLFASEPRALQASGYLRLTPRSDRIAEFTARGSIDAAATFWQGVEAVPPGGIAVCEAQRAATRTYWSLEDVLLRGTPSSTVDDVARRVRPAIVESVAAHLVSDVPVGLFLSGGVDSVALLAAAREVTSGPLKTFTITMPGSGLDEAEAARAAAARFRSDHTELSIGELDVDEAIEEFFGAMQRPSMDGLNTFLVARAARQAGARVVLSGVGADELFGGYDSFVYVPKLHRMLTWAGPSARALSPLLSAVSPRHGERLGSVFASRPASAMETWWRSRQLFQDRDLLALVGSPAPPLATTPTRASTFDQVRYCEFRFFLENQLLGDADAFTMCRALELRTPFVDHVLVEKTAAAGRWRRDRGRSYKATLFARMEGLALRDSLQRRKQGFVLPFDAWIRDALTQSAPRRLTALKSALSVPRFQPFVDRYLKGRLHWSRLWTLYVLARMQES